MLHDVKASAITELQTIRNWNLIAKQQLCSTFGMNTITIIGISGNYT